MSAYLWGSGRPLVAQLPLSAAGCVPDSPADVRQRVRSALRECGERCDARPAEDALLVASELATNAVVHGGGITGFEAYVVEGNLVLAISDRADTAPATRALPDIRPGGFGWPIIQRLARQVVVEPRRSPPGTDPRPDRDRPAGKTITVTLPLH